MKSIFLFVLLACSTLMLNAKNSTEITPTEDLQKQLTEMVVKSDIWESADNNVKLMVTFTINHNGELVILSTSNSQWDSALKSALNYKKVKVDNKVKNQIFHLPISLKSAK